MSDGNDPPNLGAHSLSTSGNSQKDKPRRFEPITHDQDQDYADGDEDEDEQSTRTMGTIRRNRPPAISISSRDHYGMFTSTADDCC